MRIGCVALSSVTILLIQHTEVCLIYPSSNSTSLFCSILCFIFECCLTNLLVCHAQVLSRFELLSEANRLICQELLEWCLKLLTPKNARKQTNPKQMVEIAHSAFPGMGSETLASLVLLLQREGLKAPSCGSARSFEL